MTLLCRACGAPAIVEMAYGGEKLALACFPCADAVMRQLCFDNVACGGSVVESADGYYRWRGTVGRDCTREEALRMATWLNGVQP